MKLALGLAAAPLLLGAASDHNAHWNTLRAKSQATSLLMIDAALKGNDPQFASMIEPTAQIQIWDDASTSAAKHRLSPADIRAVASACLTEDVSPCVRDTQVSFDCGSDKHRLLLIETNDQFKVSKVVSGGPPPICEVIKPEPSNG